MNILKEINVTFGDEQRLVLITQWVKEENFITEEVGEWAPDWSHVLPGYRVLKTIDGQFHAVKI